jgi:hypothetical protein
MAPADRAAALVTLRTTPRLVETSLQGTPRTLIQWMPAPGCWSILDVLAHCLDVEAIVYAPVYAVIAVRAASDAVAADGEAASTIPPYDAHGRALARGSPEESPLELLRAWKRARRDTLAHLESLPEAAWETPVGRDAVTFSLAELVGQHAAHDRAHAKQITGNVERHAVLGRFASLPGDLGNLLDGAGELPAAVTLELARLADHERRMLVAYAQILEQERPLLSWLGSEPTAAAVPRPAAATLRREFEKLRGATHSLLYAASPRQWQRRGVDPRLGERTLAAFVARHLDHDTERLAALRAALTCSPAASPPR